MRPIRLPEPPNGSFGVPEIFNGGIHGVIRRAIVIGNGFPGAENQCLGLVRALGLSGRHSLYVSILLFPEITWINYAFTKSKFWSSPISQIEFDHNSINFRVLWGLVVYYIYYRHSTLCNLLLLSEISDGDCMEDTLVNAHQKLGRIFVCKLVKLLAYLNNSLTVIGLCLLVQRVMRPRGGTNAWLRWLPVSVHKKLDSFIKQVFGDSSRKVEGKNGMPLMTKKTGNTL